MAEMKTLNTRIKLRIDTLENWNASTATLLPGEIAFATVAASAGTGLTEPVVMAKIATEEGKTFAQLPWAFYSKASDVLAACKSEDALKTFINGVIADAGIATNDALSTLAGRVTTAEGKITAAEGEIDTLQSEMDAVEAKAAANEADITALEGLVGDKKVATQISEAIAALDLANTYEAKGEAAKVSTALETYKTSNDAAVQKNATDIAGEIARAKAAEEANAGAISAIKDGTTIDSFADVEAALAGKQATGDYATKAEAQGYADAKDEAIAEAKKAGTDAAAAAKAAQDDVDALEALVGDTKVSEQISGAIEDLDLANTYAAKEHKHVKADITDFAHNHEMAEVNGLVDALAGKQAAGDYATKSEAQGYADAKDEAIAAAKKAGDDAQADVDALALYVGTIPEGATATDVIGYVQEKTAGIATDTALEELTGRVATAEGAIDAIEADYLKAADKEELAGDIAEVSALVGDTKVSDQISTAVAAEAEIARAAEKANADAIKAISDDYLKAADKTELQNQITTNANAIERLTNGVSAEEVDGVNDLIQYVKDHGTEVTGIKADIKANSDAIAAEKTRAEGIEGGLDTRLQAVEAAVGETGSVATAIESAVTESKEYADEKVQALADGAVKTNADDIAALELKVGDKAVSEQIEAAIEDAKTDAANKDAVVLAELTAHAGNGDVHVTTAEKTTWNAAVQTVTAAADSGLKAVKTGTDVAIEIDDSITWVFDCGNASV